MIYDDVLRTRVNKNSENLNRNSEYGPRAQ